MATSPPSANAATGGVATLIDCPVPAQVQGPPTSADSGTPKPRAVSSSSLPGPGSRPVDGLPCVR